ncbi:MAG: methyltransferase domain-containing protein [Leptospira sp.]|nr:methyltransferase domain-containing protein [Leptospira sp.]NCS94570.1 methyltransferase domain-containing protein [Leptospira sp.]
MTVASTDKAKIYYNSKDADEFYFHVWGGEDIHIGLYDPPEIPIREASRKTVQAMADVVSSLLNKNSKVLDLGSGYGGAARYLAHTYQCKVTCFNLSEVENQRNREMNQKAKLDHLIEVIDGNFEDLPFDDSSFDVVWSEDAILHSSAKPKVFEEINRVLAKSGELIFTDPMQTDDCPDGVLQPIYDRIHLDSLGSVSLYKTLGEKAGLSFNNFKDYTRYLPIHYDRVRQTLIKEKDQLTSKISEEFLDRMIQGLGHWVEGGNKGYLSWGILHFCKN